MKRILIIVGIVLALSVITNIFLGLTVINQQMTIKDQAEAIVIWKETDSINRHTIETYEGIFFGEDDRGKKEGKK